MSELKATEHIRKQYQKLFSKDNYKAFKELEGSEWLKSNNINNLNEFIEAVNDLDDLYLFIKVK